MVGYFLLFLFSVGKKDRPVDRIMFKWSRLKRDAMKQLEDFRSQRSHSRQPRPITSYEAALLHMYQKAGVSLCHIRLKSGDKYLLVNLASTHSRYYNIMILNYFFVSSVHSFFFLSFSSILEVMFNF